MYIYSINLYDFSFTFSLFTVRYGTVRTVSYVVGNEDGLDIRYPGCHQGRISVTVYPVQPYIQNGIRYDFWV